MPGCRPTRIDEFVRTGAAIVPRVLRQPGVARLHVDHRPARLRPPARLRSTRRVRAAPGDPLLPGPASTPRRARSRRIIVLDAPDRLRVDAARDLRPDPAAARLRRARRGDRRHQRRRSAAGAVSLQPRQAVRAAVLDRVMSGGVSVNDALFHVAQHDLPFGGVGASGMGHYHGREGFDTFSKLRPGVPAGADLAVAALRPALRARGRGDAALPDSLTAPTVAASKECKQHEPKTICCIARGDRRDAPLCLTVETRLHHVAPVRQGDHEHARAAAVAGHGEGVPLHDHGPRQQAAGATSRLHNIAGKYTGKDDPVMLVASAGSQRPHYSATARMSAGSRAPPVRAARGRRRSPRRAGEYLVKRRPAAACSNDAEAATRHLLGWREGQKGAHASFDAAQATRNEDAGAAAVRAHTSLRGAPAAMLHVDLLIQRKGRARTLPTVGVRR